MDRLIENVGVYLEQRDVPLAERRAAAQAICSDLAGPPHDRGKAAAWLTYRALLDDKGEAAVVADARTHVMNSLLAQVGEADEFRRARWSCSLLMAMAYLDACAGADPRPFLRPMRNLNWLAINPPCGVNICRSQALLAAAEAQAGDFRAATRAVEFCQEAFRYCAVRMALKNVANCAGHELVICAKAVHITVALLPHCRMPYQGESYGAAVLLAIDESEPFKSTLARLLPATAA